MTSLPPDQETANYRRKLRAASSDAEIERAWREYLRDIFLRDEDTAVFLHLQQVTMFVPFTENVIQFYLDRAILEPIYFSNRLNLGGKAYYDELRRLGLVTITWDAAWIRQYHEDTYITEKNAYTNRNADQINEKCEEIAKPLARSFIKAFHEKYVPQLKEPETYARGLKSDQRPLRRSR